MKHSFSSILGLTFVGFILLVSGAFYFGAPLFGWIIMGAIFAVYIVEQIVALKKIKSIARETNVLDEFEKEDALTERAFVGEGVVINRLKLAQNLTAKGIALDSPLAYEVLSSQAGFSISKSSSGTVILLGLMGTFFGLMSSVATAGGAIDNSTTQGTLDTIQNLFQGMKGIFGTSLCGLFAALVLNSTKSILTSVRDNFQSRLDKLTLNMTPQKEENENQSETEKLFTLVSENLKAMTNSLKQELSTMVSSVASSMSETVLKMSNSVSASVEKVALGAIAPMENHVNDLQKSIAQIGEKIEGIGNSVEKSLGGVGHSVSESLSGVGDLVKDSLGGVGDTVKESLSGIGDSVKEVVQAQIQNSNEEWSAFILEVKKAASEAREAEIAGLEALKNVAAEVSQKAKEESLELSSSFAESLKTLSSDILNAFQKLSDTTTVLLDAQKTLTASIDERVIKERDAAGLLGDNMAETAELMRVNQSELSANLEMLRSALETILEKLSGDTEAKEEEDNFVEQLNQTLEAFHERASEILLENAVKTQEILLEVLEQTQRAVVTSQKAEG